MENGGTKSGPREAATETQNDKCRTLIWNFRSSKKKTKT